MDQAQLKKVCGEIAYNEVQAENLFNLYKPYLRRYLKDVTGDVCVGDEIIFAEAIFTGSYRKPKFSHFELIRAKVVNDSYGSKKQQHTFTLLLPDGLKVTRKGRNVYRYLTLAKPRRQEDRKAALEDKHDRGYEARQARELRRERESFYYYQ